MNKKNADLDIGGYVVKTLDDLKSRFSKEEIYNHYENFDLQYFLKANGYAEELKEVMSITSTEKDDIINELCKIFDVNIDEEAIAKKIFETKINLIEYKKEYDAIIDEINQNPNNMTIIQNCLNKLVSIYKTFIDIDKDFFNKLPDTLVMLVCLLKNKTFRELYYNGHIDAKRYFRKIYDIYLGCLIIPRFNFRDQFIVKEENSTYIAEQRAIFKDKILFFKDFTNKNIEQKIEQFKNKELFIFGCEYSYDIDPRDRDMYFLQKEDFNFNEYFSSNNYDSRYIIFCMICLSDL